MTALDDPDPVPAGAVPHTTSPTCPCGPLIAPVRYDDGSPGVLVVHDEAGALDPARDVATLASELGAHVIRDVQRTTVRGPANVIGEDQT